MTGTVFFVSHDRYFINQTATRILELTGEMVVNYIGNYDYYLEKHEELTKIYVNPSTKDVGSTQPAEEAAPAAKADWQEAESKTGTDPKDRKCVKKDGEEDRGAGNEDCRDRRSICKAGKCNQFGKAK